MCDDTISLDKKKKTNRVYISIAITIYGFSSLVFLSMASIPHSWITGDKVSGQLQVITIVHPSVSQAIFVLALCCCVVLLAICIFGFARKKFLVPGVACVLALVGFPVSCGKSVVDNLAEWTTEDGTRGPDGREYYFLDSSFMQGQTMAIARLKEQTRFTSTMEVLGTTNGDWPRNWASVIRPKGTPVDDYGQLYLSPNKSMLTGIRNEFKCYMAYDWQRDKFLGRSDSEIEDIKSISPFVLIGSNTEMNSRDVEEVIEHVKSHTQNSNDNGIPRLQVLENALGDPNPRVRVVARELLEIIKSHNRNMR
jgi:hypothetical protein